MSSFVPRKEVYISACANMSTGFGNTDSGFLSEGYGEASIFKFWDSPFERFEKFGIKVRGHDPAILGLELTPRVSADAEVVQWK